MPSASPAPVAVRPDLAPSPSAGRSRASALLLAAGLLLIGANLRIGVASVGPVLPDIRASLGMSAAAGGLLTTIPVLAFGAFAFLTPPLTKRLGMHRLLGAAMLVLALGFLVRLLPGMAGMFTGTVLVGAGIAVSNVVMPAAIKQDFARHAGPMMGLYGTVLFLGAAAASGLTAPLASALGGWRPALALGAIPAAVAIAVWVPQMLRRSHGPAGGGTGAKSVGTGEPTFRALVRDPTALAVTAFMGLQSMSYYVFLTWVPTLLHDAGMDASTAGWMVSFSTGPAILASLASPAILLRIRRAGIAVIVSAAPIGLAYIGLALAPVEGAYVWMTLLGIGQGMTFNLAMSLIVRRSPDAHHTAHLSTLAQGVGYLLAGIGPLGIGALHSATDGWALPLAALGGMLVLQLLSGAIASRERYVLSR